LELDFFDTGLERAAPDFATGVDLLDGTGLSSCMARRRATRLSLARKRMKRSMLAEGKTLTGSPQCSNAHRPF
jgi:hypothetical protein